MFETEEDPSSDGRIAGAFILTELSHPQYFSGTYLVEASGISHLQEVTINVEITPHAYINLHLVNNPEIDGNYFLLSYLNKEFYHQIISYESELDTTLLVSGENKITQRIKRELNPDPADIETDSIYLSAFETTDITFEY